MSILLQANHSDQIIGMSENFAHQWQYCRQKFVFVIEMDMVSDAANDTRQWVEKIFRIFRQHHIINVLVVLEHRAHVAQVYYSTNGMDDVALADATSSLEEFMWEGMEEMRGDVMVNVSMEPMELRIIPSNVDDTRTGFYGVDGDLAELMEDR